MTDMQKYGLNDRFLALAGEYAGLTVARILSQERGLYRAVCESGEVYAEVGGKLRYQADTLSDFPAVGDFVMLDAVGEGERARIGQVLPRKSAFVRKSAGTAHTEQVVASNIDTVFICMSLNNDFNLRRLERYLAVSFESGASPVVVLTKADLCDDLCGRQLAAESVAMGVTVLTVCAMEQDGYAQILSYIQPGKTVAFLGSSGVGKSTLINRLLGENKLDTQGLRSDDKGRHTTTRRELMLLPCGGLVMDTPGMREMGMWDSESGVTQTFADIAALEATCRYSDCTHENEPGCAVRAAIVRGEITEERLNAYRKLKNENIYAQDTECYLAAKEKKFKDISKINKANRKKDRI